MMNDKPDAEISGPVKSKDRNECLDVLRGFALLGILVPNIQAYSMIGMAYNNPTAYGDFTGLNVAVWYATQLAFEMKFMTIFSALFGAGILLMTDRAAKADRRPGVMHFRRMGWLLLFGLAHGHLLWYGDVLFCYSICGMVVFWLRKLKPWKLLVIGFLLLGIGSAISLGFGFSLTKGPEEAIDEFSEQWRPSQATVDEELATYRGSWLDQLPTRSATALMFETFLLLFLLFWRAAGLMLIGMALYKWNILKGDRSSRFYVKGCLIGLVVGFPLVAFANHLHLKNDFAMEYSFFLIPQINYWASLFVSFGYMSAIMLLCRSEFLSWLKRSLAAVGRMALSNYLAHSIVCTTLFYGHGFGLFGHLERTQQVGVILAIWIVQLVLSPIWLTYFRFGPFEWVWRSLVYWRPQPFKQT